MNIIKCSFATFYIKPKPCYNFDQLDWKPIVVNLNTTFNLIDFSYAAFLHGASGRFTIALRCVALVPVHPLVPCTKAVFCFPCEV